MSANSQFSLHCRHVTVAQVQAHLNSQVSALASGLDLSAAHSIALLRRHGWSYGDVMRALDAQPGLLAQAP